MKTALIQGNRAPVADPQWQPRVFIEMFITDAIFLHSTILHAQSAHQSFDPLILKMSRVEC